MDLSFPLYVTFVFVLGLIIGSFLNVVIHRVPRGESIVFPGSHCPSCGRAIRPFDNIPLLSFLLLRGQCRGCHRRISPVYPLVELLTALLFIAIFIKGGPVWEAALEMTFACIMLALVFIDARHHMLPNVITYPAFVFALSAAALRGGWGAETHDTTGLSLFVFALDSEFVPWRAALIGGLLLASAAPGFWLLDRLDLILFNKYFEWEEMNREGNNSAEVIEDEEHRSQFSIYAAMVIGLLLGIAWAVAMLKFSPQSQPEYEGAYNGLIQASIRAAVGSGAIWTLRTLYFYIRGIEGMGLGDVKMMAIIGAFLTWQGMLRVLLLASILGSVVGIVLALRSKRGLRTALPFGVCLGIASLIAMLMAMPLFEWSVQALGIASGR